MMTPLVLRGRCACGRAEYAVHAAQLDAAVCYCATCRRSSGGAGMAWLTADRATLRVNGALQAWRSSDHASRQFCPHCATQLFCLEDDAPQELKVAAGTLDVHQEGLSYTVLARRNHFGFALGSLEALDAGRKTITLSEILDTEGGVIVPRRTVSFTWLVLALGSGSNAFGTPGIEHAYLLENVQDAQRFHGH